jgi:hypothetical protein
MEFNRVLNARHLRGNRLRELPKGDLAVGVSGHTAHHCVNGLLGQVVLRCELKHEGFDSVMVDVSVLQGVHD